MSTITQPVLQRLSKHLHTLYRFDLKQAFYDDRQRFKKYSLSVEDIFLDYSKNIITDTTRGLLVEWAEALHLQQAIQNLMSSDCLINHTEQRPALHMALRHFTDDSLMIGNNQTREEVKNPLAKMQSIVAQIHNKRWCGYTGKPITDVISIGIGGSDLGPRCVVNALKPFHKNLVNVHFLSHLDGADISETLKSLNPETTLFIIISKSFSTQETLTNAATAKRWLSRFSGSEAKIINHFIAVTSQSKRAEEWGVESEHILTMPEWVGGRFSLWSAVGLPIALTIGMDHFLSLLNGAQVMDEHFVHAPLDKNMPVLLALIGAWYVRYFQYPAYSVMPYSDLLRYFPAYVQQLDMESLGKSVERDGVNTQLPTGPILLPGLGTDSQHAFMQSLHQGSHTIPVDFIVALKSHYPFDDHREQLYANCLAQSRALMQGFSETQALQYLLDSGMEKTRAQQLAKYYVMPGNRPSNTIVISKITPKSVGQLIALYEHKIFVQSVLFNINPFDQWGVELGKRMTKTILRRLQGQSPQHNLDPSTQGLIDRFTQA